MGQNLDITFSSSNKLASNGSKSLHRYRFCPSTTNFPVASFVKSPFCTFFNCDFIYPSLFKAEFLNNARFQLDICLITIVSSSFSCVSLSSSWILLSSSSTVISSQSFRYSIGFCIKKQCLFTIFLNCPSVKCSVLII